MEVLQLIDTLHDLVRDAKHVPLRGEVRVDREKLSDLLDELRATIPEEINEARWIVKERGEMLAAAEREAERILGEAQELQTELVAEHHLTGEAELASAEIIEGARDEEHEIRVGAEDYADEILDTFEGNLSKFIAAVQRGRERLRGPDEPATAE
jgi:cell division septum initiation protein DivIVA